MGTWLIVIAVIGILLAGLRALHDEPDNTRFKEYPANGLDL